MALKRIFQKFQLYLWGIRTFITNGRAELLIVRTGGLGDLILCTAVLRELRYRGCHRIWLMSNHRDIFLYNEDFDVAVPEDDRYVGLTRKLSGRIIYPSYTTCIYSEDRDKPPTRHIISCMCHSAGITGSVSLRPYLTLLKEEKERGKLGDGQIVIQTSGLGARYPMRNKEWFPERFQEVVDCLFLDYTFVQIGSVNDPPLKGVVDMRGKTSIRGTAAIMSQSMVFVGLVGGLMHLARAVNCSAVIIYGGREHPDQSGYLCNENLFSEMPCSPCWRWQTCDYNRECMRRIAVNSVLDAINWQVRNFGSELRVQIDKI